MEPRMGDGENWTNQKFRKLNQRKYYISSFLSAERLPHINVLSITTINVETGPRMGDGENWTNWKFRKLNQWKICVSSSLSVNGISVSAILKKLKNGCHFININSMEKFQITNPPKVWVSSFLSVNRNGISALAILKKIEIWLPFHKYWLYGKISNYRPPKSLSLRFSECWQKWNISIGHYEKILKMAAIS